MVDLYQTVCNGNRSTISADSTVCDEYGSRAVNKSSDLEHTHLPH